MIQPRGPLRRVYRKDGAGHLKWFQTLPAERQAKLRAGLEAVAPR